jgi:hypothetical protein
MPLSMIKALGMECTRYYETSESMYAIDSRKFPNYRKIKYFCVWITTTPHINTIFTIIVFDFPPTYGIMLGRDWCSLIEGYIMSDRSCMMLPNKYGTMIRVILEDINPISFKKKENEVMQNYVAA